MGLGAPAAAVLVGSMIFVLCRRRRPARKASRGQEQGRAPGPSFVVGSDFNYAQRGPPVPFYVVSSDRNYPPEMGIDIKELESGNPVRYQIRPMSDGSWAESGIPHPHSNGRYELA